MQEKTIEGIQEWNASKKYLKYKNNQLYYFDINLFELVKKFGCPLKAGYPEVIKEKVDGLKAAFEKSINAENYKGKFYYATANKASYYAENVITAGLRADYIETSSVPDLMIVERIMKKGIVPKKKIICNGIKDDEYLELIFKLVNEGFEILNIIDNINEFEKIKNYNFKKPIEIGLRVKLKNIYSKNPKIAEYDRFGLYENEMIDIINTYKQNPNIKLTTIHYHQRGSLFSREKFLKSLSSAFKVYANMVKRDNNITTFNIGGGCPYSKIEEYDYQEFTNLTIKTLKELSQKFDVKEPDIIEENGRYTVSDACFNIYKVIKVKQDDKPWYIVNDSFMTSLPNTWALAEEFLILPINLTENKKIPVRLAGNTCDGDDVYYYQSKKEFMLPEIKDGQTLYIGVFGMGAYQEILSGIGGIHHCLNREENDLIIYKKKGKNKFYYVRKSQSIKYLFKRLLYKKKSIMKRFTEQ